MVSNTHGILSTRPEVSTTCNVVDNILFPLSLGPSSVCRSQKRLPYNTGSCNVLVKSLNSSQKIFLFQYLCNLFFSGKQIYHFRSKGNILKTKCIMYDLRYHVFSNSLSLSFPTWCVTVFRILRPGFKSLLYLSYIAHLPVPCLYHNSTKKEVPII